MTKQQLFIANLEKVLPVPLAEHSPITAGFDPSSFY
jgi:hypothetical protein